MVENSRRGLIIQVKLDSHIKQRNGYAISLFEKPYWFWYYDSIIINAALRAVLSS